MAKRNDRIITSVYLTKEMCEQVDRMAAKGHISRNEQIRRYIEKGLDVEGYSQNIDFIADYPAGTSGGLPYRGYQGGGGATGKPDCKDAHEIRED